MSCLLAGYRKSLLYDILPYFNIFAVERTDRIIIIVSPLCAINDFIIKHYGQLASEVTAKSANDDRFKCGNFRFIVSFSKFISMKTF